MGPAVLRWFVAMPKPLQLLSGLLAAGVLAAQSPFPLPSVAGALVETVTWPGGASYSVAAGCVVTPLFSLSGIVANPGDMTLGPGGHLYIAPVAGAACGAPPTVHLTQVQMQGRVPVQPLVASTFTTSPIPAFQIVYDPLGGSIYAAGTCDQTSLVYRIGSNGVPQALNNGSPFNDPDGVAFGRLHGRATPYLFVAVQDGLRVLDVGGPVPVIHTVPLDLSALGLALPGNWGSLLFDPRTGTLLGSGVGAPAVYRTVEISFTVDAAGALSAVAAPLFPSTLRPLAVDPRGVRLWSQGPAIGFLDGTGAGASFTPLLSGLGGATVEALGDGSFFVLDHGSRWVFRLDPMLRTQLVMLPAGAGGLLELKLQGPPGRASEPYLLLAGASGAVPGVPWGATSIPLNFDAFTVLTHQLALLAHPAVPGWLGVLDSNGKGYAQLVVPGGALPPGLTLGFAYILAAPDVSSNAVWIHTF